MNDLIETNCSLYYISFHFKDFTTWNTTALNKPTSFSLWTKRTITWQCIQFRKPEQVFKITDHETCIVGMLEDLMVWFYLHKRSVIKSFQFPHVVSLKWIGERRDSKFFRMRLKLFGNVGSFMILWYRITSTSVMKVDRQSEVAPVLFEFSN